MGFIIVFLIAVISFLLLNKVAQATKIPLVLWLILIGILFGSYGLYDLFGQIDLINESVNELQLVSGWAVILLFLMSGVGLNVPAIKQSGKNAAALSIIPVYIEGFIMGFVAYLLFLALPITDFKFSLAFFMMVMAVFAMASPAIIIPLCFKGKAINPKGKIYDEMMIASIMDNFTPFPLLIIYLTLAISLASGDALSVSSLAIGVLGSIVSLVVAYVIGHIIGLVSSQITKVESIPATLIVILHIIITLIAISLLGKLGASYGIMIGLGSGVGMNIGIKDADKKVKVLGMTQKLYGLLFMPTIFIYVGTKIQLDLLLNPIIILSLALITVISIIVKGFISNKYLLSQGYNKTDSKLSGSLFAAKGIILINISLIIAPALNNVGADNVLQYMYILAAVATLISVPYSIVKSEKLLEESKN